MATLLLAGLVSPDVRGELASLLSFLGVRLAATVECQRIVRVSKRALLPVTVVITSAEGVAAINIEDGSDTN
jgi:hypothetical protein